MEGSVKDEGGYLLSLSTSTANTQDSPEPEETRREKCKKYIILSSLFMAYLLVSAAYSIMAPFYPQEAQLYGVGSLTVGLIVGTTPLCVVILSPVLGYFIPEIGLKFMLISGCFLVGGSYVLLGFLIDMYSRFEFILFSVLLRVVEGIGTAGYSTALFTMATVLYPKSTGAVIGILEVGSGIGFSVGPPLGGLLYEFGGFHLPFVVVGGLTLFFIPFFICVLPNARGQKQFIPPRTLLKLCTNVPFLMLGSVNIVVFGALGFFTPVLAPFLKEKFDLSELSIGLVLLALPACYILTSLLAGKLTDLVGPRFFIIGGLIVIGTAYFFLGPANFIYSQSYLWITCVTLCVIGIAMGFTVVPIFPDMLNTARHVDPNIDYETMSGIISGMSSSTSWMGEFIGPVIAGTLTQALSFQMSAVIYGQLIIAKGLLLLGVTMIDRLIFKR